MKKTIAILTGALMAAATSASAATISLSVFDLGDYNNATGFTGFVVEDFESYTPGVVGPVLNTTVGDFTTAGGAGTGDTCLQSGGGPTCTELAIFDTAPNSQGSLIPTAGTQSLNSNDTRGIVWDVFTGSTFNRIVFALTDAGDQGSTVSVVADGTTAPVNFDLTDGNEKLIVIDFDGFFTNAMVTIAGHKSNDGMAIDGAAVGVVPLPAAGLLLLGGLGALGAMRRRKDAA